MRKGIHPDYKDAVFTCACGNEIRTRSTIAELNLEICSACHPFFTGKQKLIDSAGRVERFMKKYGDTQVSTGKKPSKKAVKRATKTTTKTAKPKKTKASAEKKKA